MKIKPTSKKLDKETEELVKTWDVVTCKLCGKKVSMLNAVVVDGKYFVCHKCLKWPTSI